MNRASLQIWTLLNFAFDCASGLEFGLAVESEADSTVVLGEDEGSETLVDAMLLLSVLIENIPVWSLYELIPK